MTGSQSDIPSEEELRGMSTEQAMLTGAVSDDVHLVHRRNRFPVPGTKAEKRAERTVAACFVISALAGVGFIVAFIAAPYHYKTPSHSQNFRFYTPMLGGLLGIMLAALGIGAILWSKWLMPEEEFVQERHDQVQPGEPEQQVMTGATLMSGINDTGLPRRGLLVRTLFLAGGALATVPLVALIGGLLKAPRKTLFHTLFHPQPEKYPNGIPIVYSDGRRVSPNDIQPGGIVTVFPGVPGGITSASSPTLIIRLRPGQGAEVHARKGQGSWGFEDFVAYSKICTHAGCPASLYEQQTTRLLCPCHQSQFEVLKDAKPVFGPATRSLPKLKLAVEVVDGTQYFVAPQDYQEPIGPGFWERG
ncbi:MAG TPA: ubiquinol-cytochrome c reductase iron-sulfur subunit [Jatrophihabitantaceae bacterium]|jgi:ubiquinol-cytochrome c reductase iron-sulfur subunit